MNRRVLLIVALLLAGIAVALYLTLGREKAEEPLRLDPNEENAVIQSPLRG